MTIVFLLTILSKSNCRYQNHAQLSHLITNRNYKYLWIIVIIKGQNYVYVTWNKFILISSFSLFQHFKSIIFSCLLTHSLSSKHFIIQLNTSIVGEIRYYSVIVCICIFFKFKRNQYLNSKPRIVYLLSWKFVFYAIPIFTFSSYI